jgi:hypothetical protein
VGAPSRRPDDHDRILNSGERDIAELGAVPGMPPTAGFEITTNDRTAARTFYEGLFGWTAQGDPDVYLMFPPADSARLVRRSRW